MRDRPQQDGLELVAAAHRRRLDRLGLQRVAMQRIDLAESDGDIVDPERLLDTRGGISERILLSPPRPAGRD